MEDLATAASAVSSGTVEDAIRAAERMFEEAFNRSDSTALAELYTADAAALPPGAPRADGQAAIRQVWQEAIQSGLKELSLRAVEIVDLGDTAYATGTATFTIPTSDGGTQPATGKYIEIWQRGAGDTWRLHRDIWNLN